MAEQRPPCGMQATMLTFGLIIAGILAVTLIIAVIRS